MGFQSLKGKLHDGNNFISCERFQSLVKLPENLEMAELGSNNCNCIRLFIPLIPILVHLFFLNLIAN